MSGRAIQSARIGLLAAVVYTVAMSLSAFVNWYYNADTIIAWVLYGTLGSLASIIALYGGYYLSKGEYALRMSFLFFIIMAISNFLDEITQNAAEIQLSEFWFIGGMFIFLASLIYNKIKLNR